VIPSQLYQARIAGHGLKADPAQTSVLQKLDGLAIAIAARQPSGWRSLLGRKAAAIRGLYIYGDVGRGKTMLMDLFYESVEGLPKRRVHFHGFMQDVHRRRAALRGEEVIERIADELVAQAKLLCLDEMQIVDIADAMIVGRLFEALERRGVVLVTTSNVPPEGLYKDGLNRDLFVPFIAQLRAKLDVVTLDGARDYRLGRIAARASFIVPVNLAEIDAFWDDLTDSSVGAPGELAVLGRTLHVPRVAHGCARFSFTELCEKPLGPADYLAIAAAFRTVFVDGIPVMTALDRNAVKRFVLMIDTFYDAGIKLVATADVQPEKLYPRGGHGFEFKRTVSRLQEMQAATWWHTSQVT
jgi:cell division protein ZapE